MVFQYVGINKCDPRAEVFLQLFGVLIECLK
jgi:hypothetical protein